MTTNEARSRPAVSPLPPKKLVRKCSSIYDDAELLADELPAGGEVALRHARYDGRGFLSNFENTSAYTCPRPAPSPAHGIHPVLMAARSKPSPLPNEPLPLLPLREPPIAFSYESTSPWSLRPPSSLPADPVRLSQTYRNGCLDQRLDGKQPVNKRGRYNLQGYWLARRTLRGLVQQQPGNGLEVNAQAVEQTKPIKDPASQPPLWSRARNSARRACTSTRLSLSKGIEEFARAAERVGHLPST